MATTVHALGIISERKIRQGRFFQSRKQDCATLARTRTMGSVEDSWSGCNHDRTDYARTGPPRLDGRSSQVVSLDSELTTDTRAVGEPSTSGRARATDGRHKKDVRTRHSNNRAARTQAMQKLQLHPYTKKRNETGASLPSSQWFPGYLCTTSHSETFCPRISVSASAH